MNEAEKLMKGSVHEENFFIIQDALVLMTLKETINWMRQTPQWTAGWDYLR